MWKILIWSLLLATGLDLTAGELERLSRVHRKLSAWGNQVAFIREDGSLWGWSEWASFGMRANGRAAAFGPRIHEFGGTRDWATVSVGANSVLAVKVDGTLWGYAERGDAGHGVELRGSDHPLVRLDDSGGWADAFGHPQNFLAIKTDGSLWRWRGRCRGDYQDPYFWSEPTDRAVGNVEYRIKRVGDARGWTEAAIDFPDNVALKRDGTLWFLREGDRITELAGQTRWRCVSPHPLNGPSPYPLLGVSLPGEILMAECTVKSNTVEKFPKELPSGGDLYGLDEWRRQVHLSGPVPIGSGTNWLCVSQGAERAAAVRQDGTIWHWMWSKAMTPQPPGTGIWKRIAIRQDWISAAAGTWTFAVAADGSLWAWAPGRHGVRDATCLLAPPQSR